MDNYLGISTILNMVDAAIQNYTQSTFQALSTALAPTLRLLLILYVSVFGIGYLTGRAEFDVWKCIRHLLGMLLVSEFVSRWDFFTLYFGNVFTNSPAVLMGVISGGSAMPNGALGDVLDRGILAANAINQLAGFSTPGFLIVGYSVFYMALASVAYALYLLILSKIALAILLGLAPLFFLFALFERTRDFFTHFVRQVFNFALIPVFTSAILAIMLKLPEQALIQLQTTLSSHTGHGGHACAFVLISFFIIFGLLHQVTGFAAGLSGGGLHLHPGGFAALSTAVGVGATQNTVRRVIKTSQYAYRRIRARGKGSLK